MSGRPDICGQRAYLSRLGDTTIDDMVQVVVEILWKQLCEQCTVGRCLLGRFQDGSVASGHSTDLIDRERKNRAEGSKLTRGESIVKTGTLKGPMIRIVPFGSARSFGLMAKKLRLNSAFCGFVHFSTLSYAVRTST